MTTEKRGVLLLIHPESGTAMVCKPGEGAMARSLILSGFNPVGPRGLAAAARIRAQVAESAQ